MVLTRFVNGVTEPFQKQVFAQSVASLAARAGLPPGIVEIRHQASHQQLPPLPLLRMAARQSLSWLQENYWEVQLGHLGNSRKQILSHLSQWKQLAKDRFNATLPGSFNIYHPINGGKFGVF